MAAAIHELGPEETRTLTEEMMRSGERWELHREVPLLCDKHSTGGVGDKVSLPLSALLAACGLPVVMLTGRALGHTAGTADKLESIPGLALALDRARCLELLRSTGIAIGVATGSVAPADRRLYAIRDQTATVDSLPLITASILSKKLATGAGALVLDVKTGSGAILPSREAAERLARLLVDTARSLGTPTIAWLTDMGQPLGRWVGHACEVNESLELLTSGGPPDLRALTFALCREVAALHGQRLDDERLDRAVASGEARERFVRWAREQGARGWDGEPLPLAPAEVAVSAPRGGWLAGVDCRALGLLMIEAGAGRARAGAAIDMGVALRCDARLGERVEAGAPLGRLWLRRHDEALAQRIAGCFTLAEEPAAPPPLLQARVS